ncbi:MAG: Holliday junction resolvase [Candidatus Woesearchaeota archaeon]|nr:MAG: Holliday junction resolvase [Candidatus Woesearchaeota archaeon]
MSKSKGTRVERELIYMFYDTGLWMAFRAAGSGSIHLPCPDLIAGNGKRVLAIECKAVGKGSRYLDEQQIKELLEFSRKFGAEPWIGIRYDNLKWFFLNPENLGKSKKGTSFISLEVAQKNGLKFDELIGLFKQKKLY